MLHGRMDRSCARGPVAPGWHMGGGWAMIHAMGMCIVYRAVPPHVKTHTPASGEILTQAFGPRVPLALAPMLADEDDREPLRCAARAREWGAFNPARQNMTKDEAAVLQKAFPESLLQLEPLPLAAIWGGRPARVDEHGLARLGADAVAEAARELNGRDEAWVRTAYSREEASIAALLDEDAAVECYALLREFFASAAASSCDVVIGWEDR